MVFRMVVLAAFVISLSLYGRHGEAPASVAAACAAADAGCSGGHAVGSRPPGPAADAMLPPMPVVFSRLREVRTEIEREERSQPQPMSLPRRQPRVAAPDAVE